jgi:hypothetical protein
MSRPMRGTLCVAALSWLLGSAAVLAQPVPAGRQFGLAAYLKGAYAGLKANLTQEAEKMPEADYAFKPGAAGEMRTYGQLFAHVADAQFTVCATVKGVPNPNEGHKLEAELKTKGEFVKALADSFALCDTVFAALTDTSALEFVKQGPGEVVAGGVLAGLLAHGAEMYGVGTVYLRAKNLIPPSTERQTRGRYE